MSEMSEMEQMSLISDREIKEENIKRTNYASSLVEEAVRCAIYTNADVQRIHVGLMEALSEVIGLFTHGESTSVTKDHAVELSNSILFNVDTYLLSLRDHKAALEQLRERKISELYGKGYLLNKTNYEKAKILFAKARYSRPSKASYEYNKTLDTYMFNYLKTYNPKFNAHNKLYVNLKEFGYKGGYTISGVIHILEDMITWNAGRKSDIIL